MVSIKVGSILEGKVSGLTKFGAFVDLGENKVGLVHISEVAIGYVEDVNDYLKLNDSVSVKVLSIDGEKVSLSIRQANPSFQQTKQPNPAVTQSFEEKLSKFIKDSDERNSDLKKHMDSKRGGRGTKFGGL